MSGGSRLKTNRSTANREQASPQYLQLLSSLGSSQTKHPFLFQRLLFYLSIHSTIPKDSAKGGILYYFRRKGRWDSRP